jgi:hypothetical protein
MFGMRPSGVSINPPVSIQWKGETVKVGSAAQSIKLLNIPFEEIDLFLTEVYKANPMLVSDADSIATKRVHFSDIQQYLKALKSRWLDSKIPIVDEETAEKRFKICDTCPQKIRISGCFGCSSVSKLLMHIPYNFTYNEVGCGVCSCYLNNKVWMGEEVLNEDSRNLEYPEHCWINELKKD